MSAETIEVQLRKNTSLYSNTTYDSVYTTVLSCFVLTIFDYVLGFNGYRKSTEPTLEELYLAQQQQQAAGGFGGGSAALLSQLQRDHNMLSQMGQQQQLAALLGLGGGGGPPGGGSSQSQQDSMRQALAAQMRQQQQQQPQFSQADLLALSRSGALSGLLGGGGGLGGAFGGGGGYGGFGGGGNLASELEGLQRLEELQRRQRLLQAAAISEQGARDATARPSRERVLTGMGGSGRDLTGDMGSHFHRPKSSDYLKNHVAGSLMDSGVPPVGAPTDDDLEKTPGSVIVPCRARGMPMDHNFKVIFRFASSFKFRRDRGQRSLYRSNPHRLPTLSFPKT